jgi:hypothetical protein
MKMKYWKARLQANWCEIYQESAEDVFDAYQALKLIDKLYRTATNTKRRKS